MLKSLALLLSVLTFLLFSTPSFALSLREGNFQNTCRNAKLASGTVNFDSNTIDWQIQTPITADNLQLTEATILGTNKGINLSFQNPILKGPGIWSVTMPADDNTLANLLKPTPQEYIDRSVMIYGDTNLTFTEPDGSDATTCPEDLTPVTQLAVAIQGQIPAQVQAQAQAQAQANPNPQLAQAQPGANQPVGGAGAQTNLGANPAGILQIQEMLTRLINLAVAAAFIALTVVLVIAGIKFLTSSGDPKALGAAKQTITWAFLGLLFLAVAWLVLLLIQNLTGVQITNFCLGFPGAETGCQ